MNDNDHSEGDSEVRDDENDIDEDANVLRNEVFVGSLSMVRQRGSGDWPPLQGWHTLQHHHHHHHQQQQQHRLLDCSHKTLPF